MKKSVCLLFLFLVVISFGSALVDSDGDGYLDINNCAELQNISLNLVANYELVKNIDCSDTKNWNGGAGFAPIRYFNGNFNGNRFNIYKLYINRPAEDGVGLFGYIYLNAVVNISDVGLVELSVTGNNNVGGLVGVAYDNTIISNSYSIGNVSGNGVVGGLIGLYYETIYTAYSAGNVVGCPAGGLVGFQFGGNIWNTYSRSNVSATAWNTGCNVGGLIGYQKDGGQYDYARVLYSYSTGNVTGGGSNLGGFIGYKVSGSNFDPHWDVDTSGRSNMCGSGGCDNFYGKNTTEMKKQSTFVNWNFTNIWAIDHSKNNGYPYLKWQTFNDDFSSIFRHVGNNIFIKINGMDKDLQGAINSNDFKITFNGGVTSSSIIFGHNANEIIVNVNGTVKTFAVALSDGTLNNTPAGKSPANYGGYNLIHGEYATDILVSNAINSISLQQAINDGWFCGGCAPKNCSSLGYTCGSWSDGRGGTLSCGNCSYGSCQSGGFCQATWRGFACEKCLFGLFYSEGYKCSCPSEWSIVSVSNCQYGTLSYDWTMTCRK
jgi:hypothetical protein